MNTHTAYISIAKFYSGLVIAGLLTLGLSACGGGGAPSAAIPAAMVGAAGTANLGAVLGGEVNAFAWTTGAKGALLATSITDAQGNYNLSIPANHTGAVLLELSDPTGVAVFVDEFTGMMSPFPAGAVYRSITPLFGPDPIAITPLTELVTMAAIKKVAAGVNAVKAITDASREVGIAFLNGADPIHTLPWDLRNPVAGVSQISLQYAAVLAGIQRVASTSNPPVSALAVIQGYEAQMYSATGVAGVLPAPELAKLNQQITNFQSNPPAGLNATASVTLPSGTGTSALVANPQQVSTAENIPVAITVSGNDPAGNQLAYSITVQPANGKLSGVMPNLTYTPNTAYFGADSFTFQVNNGATVAIATVSLTIQQVLGATPVAVDGSASTMEDKPVAGVLKAVDPDNEPLTYAVATQPAAAVGSVTITNTATGEFLFTPAANFNGTAQFTFTASDPHPNISPTGTVTITVLPVNDVPVANPLSVTLAEDTATAITLLATDKDNNPLTYMIVATPSHGTLTGAGQGMTYTPNANYNGPDSFTYKVNDGTVDSTVATALLNITAVNDAPVANNQTLTLGPAGTATITLSGTDADGDPLRYRISALPVYGTLFGASPAIPLTPTNTDPGGWVGPSRQVQFVANTATSPNDQIQFQVQDSQGGATYGIIAINIVDFATSAADTDGDGLIDANEVNIYGTSPLHADTDGDTLSDYNEIVTKRFDPAINNFHFNPLIADIPQVTVEILSMPNVSLNYTDTAGTTTTITTQRSTASATTFATTDSTAQESHWESSISVHGGVSGGKPDVGVEVTASYGQGTTVTKETTHQQEDTVTLDKGDAFETNNTIASTSGNLAVALRVSNSGSMPITVNNLILGATMQDLQAPKTVQPIGNLSIDTAAVAFPSFSLAPGQASGPLTFGNFALDLGTARAILADAEGINIEPAILESTNINGTPFAFTNAEIAAKSAKIVINYFDQKPREQHFVSTLSDPTLSTISLVRALTTVLKIPYAMGPAPARVLQSLNGITAINIPVPNRTLQPNNHWQARYYSKSGLTRTLTVYDNKGVNPDLTGNNPDPVTGTVFAILDQAAINAIQLKAGDELHFLYIEDTDGDGLGGRMEAFAHTLPDRSDTDGDGLTDGEEVFTSWPVSVTGGRELMHSVIGSGSGANWPGFPSFGPLLRSGIMDLDEVRLWSSARTEAQIFANKDIQLALPQPQGSGLVEMWTMDTAIAALAPPQEYQFNNTWGFSLASKNNANHLYMTNVTHTPTAIGGLASGLFPATASTVANGGVGAGFYSLPDARNELMMQDSLISSQTTMTFEARFRLATGASGVILSNRSKDRRSEKPAIYVDDTGVLHGQFWHGQVSPVMVSRMPVDDGLWHHVALVYDDTIPQQSLYLDGILTASATGKVTHDKAATYYVHSDPLKADTDRDLALDGAEKLNGTDPYKQDTDGDHILDNVDTPKPTTADRIVAFAEATVDRAPASQITDALGNIWNPTAVTLDTPFQPASVTDYHVAILKQETGSHQELPTLPGDNVVLQPAQTLQCADGSQCWSVFYYADGTNAVPATAPKAHAETKVLAGQVRLGGSVEYLVLERVNGKWFKANTAEISGGLVDKITINLIAVNSIFCQDNYTPLKNTCERDWRVLVEGQYTGIAAPNNYSVTIAGTQSLDKTSLVGLDSPASTRSYIRPRGPGCLKVETQLVERDSNNSPYQRRIHNICYADNWGADSGTIANQSINGTVTQKLDDGSAAGLGLYAGTYILTTDAMLIKHEVEFYTTGIFNQNSHARDTVRVEAQAVYRIKVERLPQP